MGSPEHLQQPEWMVEWTKGDSENPRNFTRLLKIWITFYLFMAGSIASSFGASIISPAGADISSTFGVSREVAQLTVSLFLFGSGFGAWIWGPISELYGRQVSYLSALLGLGLFTVGSAASKTLTALLVTRFFAGMFGCISGSIGSACLGDIWNEKERGTPAAFYTIASVGAPAIGSIIGAVIVATLGWRWTLWMEAIFAFGLVVVGVLTWPETYAPVLLDRRAKFMRKNKGDERYWHPHETIGFSFHAVATKHLLGPVKMLFTEPIVAFFALYASFAFALSFAFLQAIPWVFVRERGWGTIVGNLPFLGIFIGTMVSIPVNVANSPRYARKVAENNGNPAPEARLPPLAIGAVCFVVGLFWYAWTSTCQWAIPVVGSGFIGAAIGIIFIQCINYLVDAYGVTAASAVSANTITRSLLAGSLSLATRPMLQNLGVGPGISIYGGIAFLLLPVPFLLMKYGKGLRNISRTATKHEIIV